MVTFFRVLLRTAQNTVVMFDKSRNAGKQQEVSACTCQLYISGDRTLGTMTITQSYTVLGSLLTTVPVLQLIVAEYF